MNLWPVLLLLGSSAGVAQGTVELNVPDLCAAVGTQAPEINPLHDTVIHRFQNHIYRAAGVVAADNEATLNVKVRAFLNKEMPKLLCAEFNFTPTHGNILKLAIARNATPFIDLALDHWKIDLNQVDTVDGRTVLDYILLKKDQAGSNEQLRAMYERYYKRFRNAGAKLHSELQ